jgi:hypothetical protein
VCTLRLLPSNGRSETGLYATILSEVIHKRNGLNNVWKEHLGGGPIGTTDGERKSSNTGHSMKFTLIEFSDCSSSYPICNYDLSRIRGPLWYTSVCEGKRPCHSSGDYALGSHGGGLGSIPDQVLLDLWCKKWQWGGFSASTSVPPTNYYSTKCSTFINHPIMDVVLVSTLTFIHSFIHLWLYSPCVPRLFFVS